MDAPKSLLLCSALVLVLGAGPDGCASVLPMGPAAEHAEVALLPQDEVVREARPAAAEEGASSDAERVVPEHWAPPPETILPGLDGAAQLLAAGRPGDALDHLPPPAEPGTPEWFRRGAIAGRAHLALGDHGPAIEALRPLAEHGELGKHLPPELVALELARAEVAHCRHGRRPRAEADALCAAAAGRMAAAVKRKPNRHKLPMRVVYLEALFGLEGSEPRARKKAARAAIRQADRLLTELPNHADVGYWRLDRARARVRAGELREAAADLRELMIVRAGEPEAAMAWVDLVDLAEREDSVELTPFSIEEELRRAYHARELRRVATSRAILDDLLARDDLPAHRQREAMHSRAWTAYKQRDWGRCVDDLEPLYARAATAALRSELLRCLERGERYDEAIELWLEIADDRKAGKYRRPAALWSAIELSVNAGLYETAAELLGRYEAEYKGHVSERRHLRAWLAYRTGDRDGALAGFEELEQRGADPTMARYFRGKLLTRSQNADARETGAGLLREVADADPLGYYGLQARQRLLDAGFDAGPAPELRPVADEGERPDFRRRQAIYDALLARFSGVSPALPRGAQLHAVGWIDEARRELRYVADEYSNTGRRMRGIDVRVPRSESLEVGLSWAPEWTYPKPSFGREGRAVLRDAEAGEALRVGLRELAAGLDEPHRWISLTDSAAGDYRARWHPRAFRAQIEKYAARQGVDPTHLWGLMYTESRFRPFVVSYVGARGALQIMPWTCRQLLELTGEFGGHLDPDLLYDIDTNARLASLYIGELIAKFQGQAPLAYASYNGGPSNVARWVRAKSRDNALELDDFVEEIPFDETRRYTRRVMEVQAAYALLYGEGLPRWNNDVDPRVGAGVEF